MIKINIKKKIINTNIFLDRFFELNSSILIYNNGTYKLNYFRFIRDKLLLFQLLKVPS